ncbi:hypothetical protein D3C87_1787340 [compost metagenome]
MSAIDTRVAGQCISTLFLIQAKLSGHCNTGQGILHIMCANSRQMHGNTVYVEVNIEPFLSEMMPFIRRAFPEIQCSIGTVTGR